jgi:hypothetical protein
VKHAPGFEFLSIVVSEADHTRAVIGSVLKSGANRIERLDIRGDEVDLV